MTKTSRRPAGTPTRRGAPAPGADIPAVIVYVVLGLLVIPVVAVTVFSAMIVARHGAVADEEAAREKVLLAARQQALNFTTIGYKSVDRDVQRVINGATGDFRASYEQNRTTIKQTVTKNKSTSKGEVLSAGLRSVDSDSAVALVVVDASVTNVAHEKPTLQNYRMQLDLAKTGDRWLVSGVEFVG
ncbi:MAG: hypothetical protein GEV10_23380 [Streptosporangiales bacterium]|nr:hypothetical protein [Streptosporangiales bacterium]